MGFDAKVNINEGVGVELAAARRRGLLKAGDALLALSNLGVPVEPEPKHGVHGVETGFSRFEMRGGEDAVAVGYEAFWLVFQHERMDYNHPHGGHAKFLELALIQGEEEALGIVAESMRAVE